MNSNEKCKKVILVQGYFAYNLGDDLFLSVLLNRYPSMFFRIIAPRNYKFVQSFRNAKAIGEPINGMSRLLCYCLRPFPYLRNKMFVALYKRFFKKQSKGVSAFVTIGGSMFKETRGYELRLKLEKAIAEIVKKVPSFIVGANFGPYYNKDFYEFFYNLFPLYKDICFRDSSSVRMFDGLTNIRQAPDVIFQYPLENHIKKRELGVVVVDFSKHEGIEEKKIEYEKMLKSVVSYYANKGYNITLFAFQSNESEYLKKLYNRFKFNCSNLNYCVYSGDVGRFVNKYNKMSVVFATRFHAIVLSLMMGQKVCPIIYNKKIQNFLNDISFKGLFIPLDNLSLSEHFFDSFEEQNSPKVDYRNEAEEQFSALDNLLRVMQ